MPTNNKPNRLIAESPYLLHPSTLSTGSPWGEEAFEKAKRETSRFL